MLTESRPHCNLVSRSPFCLKAVDGGSVLEQSDHSFTSLLVFGMGLRWRPRSVELSTRVFGVHWQLRFGVGGQRGVR